MSGYVDSRVNSLPLCVLCVPRGSFLNITAETAKSAEIFSRFCIYVQIREREEQTLLDELLEIHFLDLTKLPKDNLTSLEKWLMFIKTDSKEVRTMLAQGNPIMAKANKVMDIFYLDEQERKRYEAAWEYESDRLSMISESERKGHERGIAEGSRQKALETAQLMKQASCETTFIENMTGLTKEEIEKL